MTGSERGRPAPLFRCAWWLSNPHAQTLWGKFARPSPKVRTVPECLLSPDGDNIELHHSAGAAGSPRVLLLHGLEGSARSHYVGGMLSRARDRGWPATLLVFRGCGQMPNVARRFYHSGETGDLDFVFATLRARWPESSWCLAGISLGGNVLLKWLGERGAQTDATIRGAAAVSVPFDLEAGSRHISRGVARIYDRSFLRSLRRKALAKLARYPDLFDLSRLERARTVYDFDEAVTAPVHGFSSAHDYYSKSSSIGFLGRIRAPTLLLSAEDDPFLPAAALRRAIEIANGNPAITVESHARGGHVGFVGGSVPWKSFYFAESRTFEFFDRLMEHAAGNGYDRETLRGRKK